MSKRMIHRTPFNLLLGKQERDMLARLAHLENVSRGNMLRILITRAAQHYDGIWRCCDGTRCYVPQMHEGRQGTIRDASYKVCRTEGEIDGTAQTH